MAEGRQKLKIRIKLCGARCCRCRGNEGQKKPWEARKLRWRWGGESWTLSTRWELSGCWRKKETIRKNGRLLSPTWITQIFWSLQGRVGVAWPLPFQSLWKAQFNSFSSAVCGESLSGMNGSFSFVSPDVAYAHDINCFWVIQTEEGKVNTASPNHIVFHLYVWVCTTCIYYIILHIMIIQPSYIEGLGQTPGDGEEQGSLACCSPWGHK